MQEPDEGPAPRHVCARGDGVSFPSYFFAEQALQLWISKKYPVVVLLRRSFADLEMQTTWNLSPDQRRRLGA
jgi:hypothetical protein